MGKYFMFLKTPPRPSCRFTYFSRKEVECCEDGKAFSLCLMNIMWTSFFNLNYRLRQGKILELKKHCHGRFIYHIHNWNHHRSKKTEHAYKSWQQQRYKHVNNSSISLCFSRMLLHAYGHTGILTRSWWRGCRERRALVRRDYAFVNSSCKSSKSNQFSLGIFCNNALP